MTGVGMRCDKVKETKDRSPREASAVPAMEAAIKDSE